MKKIIYISIIIGLGSVIIVSAQDELSNRVSDPLIVPLEAIKPAAPDLKNIAPQIKLKPCGDSNKELSKSSEDFGFISKRPCKCNWPKEVNGYLQCKENWLKNQKNQTLAKKIVECEEYLASGKPNAKKSNECREIFKNNPMLRNSFSRSCGINSSHKIGISIYASYGGSCPSKYWS